MNTVESASRVEEAFEYPDRVALFNPTSGGAFLLDLENRFFERETVILDLPGPSRTIFERRMTCQLFEALLLRSVWVRPVDPVEMTLPLQIRVLVDEEPVLDHIWKAHQVGGLPVPGACFCNRWNKEKICVCAVAPVAPLRKDSLLFTAHEARGTEAVQDRKLGIFLPNGSGVRVEVGATNYGPKTLKLICGFTAALYTTRKKA